MGDLDPDEAPLALQLTTLRQSQQPQLLIVLTDSASHRSLPTRRHALERQAFAMGWRKHPRYYLCADYEDLHQDGYPQFVALERVPDAAWAAWPLDRLCAEHDPHRDMRREAGECSDGHLIRYQLAAELIRPSPAVRCGAVLGWAGLAKCQPGNTGVAEYRRESIALMNREFSDQRMGYPLEMH
jgi:hypothetical protein